LENRGTAQCLHRGNRCEVVAPASWADNLHGGSIDEAPKRVNAAGFVLPKFRSTWR
jgi:hypothetical protein